MLEEFKAFLTKTNALALAIGVIIGAAAGKIVTKLVEDIMMPIIGLILPAGDWRDAQVVLKEVADPKNPGKMLVTAIKYGDFTGAVVDFVFIALAVFLIIKFVVRPAPEAPATPTREEDLLAEIRDAIKQGK